MPPRKQQDKQVAPRNGDAPAVRDAEQQLAPFLQGSAASQSTTIEWVRAAAEVRAAVMAAHEWPRDWDRATDELKRACRQREMARKAFYSYKRAGKTITGPTIQLARAAAACWGNTHVGMWELNRAPGWSEMMAFAVDLEKNSRFASTFRVVHIRERSEDKGGSYVLEEDETRDIYEVNTSMAARRLREMIKNMLPVWFMAIAEKECKRTMIEIGDEDDEKAFLDAVEKCVTGYERRGRFGKVPQAALERKVGAPRDAWTTNDLLTLRVLWESLVAGEMRVDAEFPELAKPVAGSADAALAAEAVKQAQAGEPAEGVKAPAHGEAGEGAGGVTTSRPGSPPAPPAGRVPTRRTGPQAPPGPLSAGEAFDQAEDPA